jgi:hypothetical protein
MRLALIAVLALLVIGTFAFLNTSRTFAAEKIVPNSGGGSLAYDGLVKSQQAGGGSVRMILAIPIPQPHTVAIWYQDNNMPSSGGTVKVGEYLYVTATKFPDGTIHASYIEILTGVSVHGKIMTVKKYNKTTTLMSIQVSGKSLPVQFSNDKLFTKIAPPGGTVHVGDEVTVFVYNFSVDQTYFATSVVLQTPKV